MSDEQNLTKQQRREQKKQAKLEAQELAESQAKQRKFLTYGIIGLAIVLIGFFIYRSYVPVPESEANKPVDQVLENDWVKGNPQAPVILVEYSDFQCPACAAYVDLLKTVEADYGNNVAIVYRHFPLKQIHLQAELAAQAAEAAGKQGKFWEMHDILFENQEAWSENSGAQGLFEQYAETIGLDVNQFKEDINSKEIRALVKADFQSGLALRINSTPTFFLQGEKIDNPRGLEEFIQQIQSALPASPSAEISE